MVLMICLAINTDLNCGVIAAERSDLQGMKFGVDDEFKSVRVFDLLLSYSLNFCFAGFSFSGARINGQ